MNYPKNRKKKRGLYVQNAVVNITLGLHIELAESQITVHIAKKNPAYAVGFEKRIYFAQNISICVGVF